MSLQEFHIGNELINKSIFNEEFINMEDVHSALDCFVNAINFSKQKDLELEAEVHSRLGKIFYKALKNDKKA
jgi:hypothetical protein